MEDTLLLSLYNRYKQTYPRDLFESAFPSDNAFHFQIQVREDVGQYKVFEGQGTTKSKAKRDAVFRFLYHIGGPRLGNKMAETVNNMRELEQEFQNLLKQ